MLKQILILSSLMLSLVANAGIFETAASVFKIDENTEYKSNWDMRTQRKFGVGASVGGNLGLFGMSFELNFEDENSAQAGFGAGPGYNAFAILWKHNFEDDYVSPYTTLGYARWFNSSASTDDVSRSGVLSRSVSDSDKRAGHFATNFVTGSLGLQYNQLSGEAAGFSIFGELTLLGEVSQSVLIPTGSIGTVYYF